MSARSVVSGPSRLTRTLRGTRRFMFLTHRWLGVALALIMALWTLSGIVMMYVSYPQTSSAERLAGLDALDLSACCGQATPPDGPIDSVSVEMLDGAPVLRWMTPEGPKLAPLSGGEAPVVDDALAARIAGTHYRNTLGSEAPVTVEPVEGDQWTVAVRRYAPLWKASFTDDRGTQLYVSGLTGQVVQDTHASERFWSWLGAVPHWLYFRPLRENGPLWSQIVIWSSLLGTFLTVTGIYIGLITFRRRGRHSPFRGIALWHHWLGLIFGIVTLTWVFSGLASMNPWGWLESGGPGEEMQGMAGRPPEATDVEALYRALAANPRPGVVSAELIVQGSRPYAVLVGADGGLERASLPDLAPAPLANGDLAYLARMAKPGVSASQSLIAQGDSYHYTHHTGSPAVLPAWRVIYSDDAKTRLYLDPRTGELVGYADPARRSFRWWHLALHRLDFSFLRQRPLWDGVMIVLLVGVSLVCLLGVWMGVRRVRRDLGRLSRGRRE